MNAPLTPLWRWSVAGLLCSGAARTSCGPERSSSTRSTRCSSAAAPTRCSTGASSWSSPRWARRDCTKRGSICAPHEPDPPQPRAARRRGQAEELGRAAEAARVRAAQSRLAAAGAPRRRPDRLHAPPDLHRPARRLRHDGDHLAARAGEPAARPPGVVRLRRRRRRADRGAVRQGPAAGERPPRSSRARSPTATSTGPSSTAWRTAARSRSSRCTCTACRPTG